MPWFIGYVCMFDNQPTLVMDPQQKIPCKGTPWSKDSHTCWCTPLKGIGKGGGDVGVGAYISQTFFFRACIGLLHNSHLIRFCLDVKQFICGILSYLSMCYPDERDVWWHWESTSCSTYLVDVNLKGFSVWSVHGIACSAYGGESKEILHCSFFVSSVRDMKLGGVIQLSISLMRTRSCKRIHTEELFGFHYRPMIDTDSALSGIICAPFLAAALAFHYRPMLVTDTTLYDLFVAPVVVAALHSRPMLDTDNDFIVAPVLVAALVFHYRSMLDTDTALYDLIVAPDLVAVSAFPRNLLLVMPHA